MVSSHFSDSSVQQERNGGICSHPRNWLPPRAERKSGTGTASKVALRRSNVTAAFQGDTMAERNEVTMSGAIQALEYERPLAAQAFQETAFERAALAEKELKRLNLHFEQATMTALGAIEQVRKLLRATPELSIDPLELQRLERYVYAAIHAQVLFKITLEPPDDLDATYRDALELRKRLRHDCENLAFHGLLNISGVKRLKFRMGYTNASYDLAALVNVLLAAWPNVSGRSAMTQQLLAHAEHTADSLLVLAATKRKSKEMRLRADNERRRAFTLLFVAYERLRRALAFIRWDERDLGRLAPALHTAKGAGRPKKNKTPAGSDSAQARSSREISRLS
jgi:hypothetical protein